MTFRQSDVTRAVKAAVDGYRARGLVPGPVSVEIRDGAIRVHIEPADESAASRRDGEIESFAEAVRRRASRRT